MKKLISAFLGFVFMLVTPLLCHANEDGFKVHNDTENTVKVTWLSDIGDYYGVPYEEETLYKGEEKSHRFHEKAEQFGRSIILFLDPQSTGKQYCYKVYREDKDKSVTVSEIIKSGKFFDTGEDPVINQREKSQK